MSIKESVIHPVMAGALFFLGFSHQVLSASYTGQYFVTQIVVDATAYRGCMFALTPQRARDLTPVNAFPDSCAGSFVSVACDGSVEGIAKGEAQQLLSQAQLAFVTNKPVVVRFQDGNTVTTPEGYCVADRVDVF